MKISILLTAFATAGLTTACSTSAINAKPAMEPASFTNLLTSDTRPIEDSKDDAARKPADVLSFMGVTKGQTIFEIESGGGYYTELFSKAVGENGKIYMQNPLGFDQFLGDSDDKRLTDSRLANVEYIRSQFDDFPAPDASVDTVTWILGPHEIYFIPEGTNGFGSDAKSYSEIFRILKPGGSFIAIDHIAPTGTGKQAGHDLHRIEKSVVIEAAQSVGLELTDSSKILENSDDPLNISPFDPQVRRKTSRFLLKFTKSE